MSNNTDMGCVNALFAKVNSVAHMNELYIILAKVDDLRAKVWPLNLSGLSAGQTDLHMHNRINNHKTLHTNTQTELVQTNKEGPQVKCAKFMKMRLMKIVCAQCTGRFVLENVDSRFFLNSYLPLMRMRSSCLPMALPLEQTYEPKSCFCRLRMVRFICQVYALIMASAIRYFWPSCSFMLAAQRVMCGFRNGAYM